MYDVTSKDLIHPSGEPKTKLDLFMARMKEENIAIERDLLLRELALKQGYSDDLRYSYFLNNCGKYDSPISIEEQKYHIALYLLRLSDLVQNLKIDGCLDLDTLKFSHAITMIHILISNGRIAELDQCFRATYPEYYQPIEEAKPNT